MVTCRWQQPEGGAVGQGLHHEPHQLYGAAADEEGLASVGDLAGSCFPPPPSFSLAFLVSVAKTGRAAIPGDAFISMKRMGRPGHPQLQ